MTAMPLCFVVCISMLKDLFEDRGRGKQDKEENNSRVQAAHGATELTEMASLEL